MRAITYQRYGMPEQVMQLTEVPRPTPKANEVLVKVHAVSLNHPEWVAVRGIPRFARLLGQGIFKPKTKILGSDIAGEVEAVGAGVQTLQPGQQVFAELSVYGLGGLAEYVCAPEQAFLEKPENMTYEQAAAVPQGALVALQGLRDKGEIQAGKKVLVIAASGGIGSYAVQIAKAFGAEVTGVCSTGNLELVRSLGADAVIDYTREDFAANGSAYDLILAVWGYRSILDYRRALNPGGIHVVVGGTAAQFFQPLLLGPLLTLGSKKQMKSFMAYPNRQDMETIKQLCDQGKLRSTVDRTYRLEQTAQALNYYGKGHSKGKVVIVM